MIICTVSKYIVLYILQCVNTLVAGCTCPNRVQPACEPSSVGLQSQSRDPTLGNSIGQVSK